MLDQLRAGISYCIWVTFLSKKKILIYEQLKSITIYGLFLL